MIVGQAVTMAERSIVAYSWDHSGHSCGYCHSATRSYSHGPCYGATLFFWCI